MAGVVTGVCVSGGVVQVVLERLNDDCKWVGGMVARMQVVVAGVRGCGCGCGF